MRRIVILLALIGAATVRAQTPREALSADTVRRWIRSYQPSLLRGDTSNVVVFFVGTDGQVKRSAIGRDYPEFAREDRADAMRALYRTKGNPVGAGPDSLLPIEVPIVTSGRLGLLDTLSIPPARAVAKTRGIPEWPHEVLVVFLK